MHDNDNVAIVVNDGGLPAGAVFADGLTLREAVPQGHKVALVDIAAGAPVVRYNVAIGAAARPLAAGSWVAEAEVVMPPARELDNLPVGTRGQEVVEPLEGYHLRGLPQRRTARSAPATSWRSPPRCSAWPAWSSMRSSASRTNCCRSTRTSTTWSASNIPTAAAWRSTRPAPRSRSARVRNISMNPNFGGQAMVVSLGCEKLQPARLFPKGSIPIAGNGGEPSHVCLQDQAHVGFMSMIDSIMKTADQQLAQLNLRQRETCPASELIVGMQCGGSDAFSGVTANPALGFATDLLVRAGATVMFSETTEVRDGIDQLTARAANAGVAEAMIAQMAWYDNYLKRGGVDRSANTTPGNKKGGLSNIVEKAMGSIVKSGSSAISGVLAPGEKLTRQGPDLRRHAGQRFHLRHLAAGRRHEPARVYHRPRHALRPGRGAGDQSGDPHRAGQALARPDGPRRRPHRQRRSHHRRRWLGTVPHAARRRQRPQDLGRAVEAA